MKINTSERGKWWQIFLLIFCFSWGLPLKSNADQLAWQAILDKARNQKVYWHAWAGNPTYNAYIDWVGKRVKSRFDITLNHIKIQNTANAVSLVLSEKKAGLNDGGTVDLIWINGTNFKAMKEQGLLYGPFAKTLPNWRLTDATEIPGILEDFTIPTEGYEAPWGLGQLTFFYDKARQQSPPRSMADLLDYARANPGRITYPAPPDFTGKSFLKQVLLETVPDRDRLKLPVGEDFEDVSAAFWQWLEEIEPFLWRAGKEYPPNAVRQDQMFDDGIIDLGFSMNFGGVPNSIKQGMLAPTVQAYLWDNGTLGNVHFIAIPFNAASPEAAMVVANFLMSPEAQARKMDPDFWGEPSILSYKKLSPDDQLRFDKIKPETGGINPNDVKIILSEPHPSWELKIEEEWLKRYGA